MTNGSCATGTKSESAVRILTSPPPTTRPAKPANRPKDASRDREAPPDIGGKATNKLRKDKERKHSQAQAIGNPHLPQIEHHDRGQSGGKAPAHHELNGLRDGLDASARGVVGRAVGSFHCAVVSWLRRCSSLTWPEVSVFA